jgi:8-oxo-dGTP pyrophosphatase MutT (NUDIX family)
MKRTTISLTDEQQRAIEELMQDESPLEAALREVVERLGLPERPKTESGVVRMLIDFGIQQVNEVTLEIGYSEMAEWYNNDPETKAIHEVLHRDYVARLAREEQEATQ